MKKLILTALAIWLAVPLVLMPVLYWSYMYPSDTVRGWIELSVRLVSLLLAAGVAVALGRRMRSRQTPKLHRFLVWHYLGTTLILWVVYIFVHWETQRSIISLFERLVSYEVNNLWEFPLPFIYLYEAVLTPNGILTFIISLFVLLLTVTYLPKKTSVAAAAKHNYK